MLTPQEIIQRLKPCHYKYKEGCGDRINFGFIAQDILETLGESYNFVVRDQGEQGLYKVNYYQFIAPIVSVLKQQQEEIEHLKEQVNSLKEKLN